MWDLAADTHLKRLDRVVSGARFLTVLLPPIADEQCHTQTRPVFECDIAHRRSVAILCMLYKIRCDQVHPLNGVLPGPYVPVRLHAVLWSHIDSFMRLLAAEPRSTAGPFFPLSVSLWNDLASPVFDGVGLAGFESMANAFLLSKAALSLL